MAWYINLNNQIDVKWDLTCGLIDFEETFEAFGLPFQKKRSKGWWGSLSIESTKQPSWFGWTGVTGYSANQQSLEMTSLTLWSSVTVRKVERSTINRQIKPWLPLQTVSHYQRVKFWFVRWCGPQHLLLPRRWWGRRCRRQQRPREWRSLGDVGDWCAGTHSFDWHLMRKNHL